MNLCLFDHWQLPARQGREGNRELEIKWNIKGGLLTELSPNKNQMYSHELHYSTRPDLLREHIYFTTENT